MLGVLILIVPYAVAQTWLVVLCRGWWRGLALLPVLWMVPVSVFTVKWFREESNFAPCLFVPALGLAVPCFWCAVLMSRRPREPRGFDVAPPSRQPEQRDD